MSPIDQSSPFRSKSINQGGTFGEFWYYYDPNTDEWLSVHVENFVFARNVGPYTGFLRTTNGVPTSATHGPLLFQDSKIVWVSAISQVVPVNIDIEIYNNGVKVSTIDWSTAELLKTMDVDVDPSNLGVNIAFSNPYTAPQYPIVQVGLRWRF